MSGTDIVNVPVRGTVRGGGSDVFTKQVRQVITAIVNIDYNGPGSADFRGVGSRTLTVVVSPIGMIGASYSGVATCTVVY